MTHMMNAPETSILRGLNSVVVGGKETLPIIEGGKGVGVSNGISAGAFAAAGGVGTFSGVNAESYDAQGKPNPVTYKGKTRIERHQELIRMGIDGGIDQAKLARDVAGDAGRVHINILWEMGGAVEILKGILDNTKGLIHGVTCGAGMPYKLAEIASSYHIHYYPIISSMRAFRALWKRGYNKYSEYLGGIVYEDPWKAGGHNGLSNSEHPDRPEDPYPRVAELRKFMNEVGLQQTPIIMAGGVWHINEWSHWLDNPEIGPIAFQFGTRPILTQESPVPEEWKRRLMTLKEGDVYLNRFSPTGFYSSAVHNDFIEMLIGRKERQIPFSTSSEGALSAEMKIGPRKRSVFVSPEDKEKALRWVSAGYTTEMRTPDDTLIYVSDEEAKTIQQDQINCMGCLSHCKFSNWKDHDDFTTGRKADPRSFCIQKTLQDIIQGVGSAENQLMFSGHNAYRFREDPFYANGHIPTVKQLVNRIASGY